ncbi:MAG: hypothetical protein ACRENL_07465 [Candidatus Dormibacteria bacterium]
MGLWVLPIVILNAANALYNGHHISFALQGVIQTACTLWIGTACFANGRRCGRVHCRIDGILLPLLSVVGIVNVLNVISFNWSVYGDAFNAIVVLSFVAEYVDNRLQHTARSG